MLGQCARRQGLLQPARSQPLLPDLIDCLPLLKLATTSLLPQVIALIRLLHIRVALSRQLKGLLTNLTFLLALSVLPRSRILLKLDLLLFEFYIQVELRLIQYLIILLPVKLQELLHGTDSPVGEGAPQALEEAILALAVQVAVGKALYFVDIELVDFELWLCIPLHPMMRYLLEILNRKIPGRALQHSSIIHLLHSSILPLHTLHQATPIAPAPQLRQRCLDILRERRVVKEATGFFLG